MNFDAKGANSNLRYKSLKIQQKRLKIIQHCSIGPLEYFTETIVLIKGFNLEKFW